MPSSKRRLGLILFASAGLLISPRTARADGCRRVHAEINLSQGTIVGNFGLTGSIAFVADSNGTPPATAPATSSVFSGIVSISTRRGGLELRETGMFSSRSGNPAGPVLSSWGEVLSGTDAYSDVTGDVFFTGQRVDGVFLIEMVGELCRP